MISSPGPLDLALGAGFVLLNAGLSAALGLGLARTMLVAAGRLVAQLALVGLALRTVFGLGAPGPVVGVVAVMALAAAYEIGARQDRPLRGPWAYALGGLVSAGATALAVAVGLAALRPHPWWDPHALIPLAGIVLGSVMSGIAIGLNGLTGAVRRERAGIEARLALGATRDEALAPLVRGAIRAGLIPVLNQMAAAGLITLPGMMTGQILAGQDPQGAAASQILILFLLAGASGLGVTGAVLAAARRLTDARHRLRLDRLA
ncbi:putative ABC transport system permease protein [Methylobacterium sp. ap11]|uniref:ABC transporter permease n=1 Tax=Methylobacterium sp. ap11 TaxID=1761799 RepID=UPI0008C9C4FD|nr:ABC transporter permease [Methylobacterium sp. ap11]SEO32879.1 putative ABC transport system permease protein [Methylobacterium sp. ap11]